MLGRRSYRINPPIALAGMPYGSDRKTYGRDLAYRAEVTRITVAAGAATDDLVLTIVDDLTGETLTVTAAGSANEATLGANYSAAHALAEANKTHSVTLAQAVDASDLIIDLTARMANRSYTVTGTGGTGAITVSTPTTAGGDGLQFGLMVARSGDSGFDSLDASSALGDCVGVLFRTEANHFHNLENDRGASVVDRCERGWRYPIMEQGEVYVEVEDAVTAGGSVFVRRAQTSSAGTVGAFRGSATGGQQTATFTPSAVDLPGYGFEFDYQGVHYTALYLGDGSTTVAQACDGLVQDLGSISGLTITDAGTAVTIQTAAGTQLENVRNLASHTDVPADSVTVALDTVAADVDTIDVSSICEYLTSAGAGELALLRVKRR